MSQITPGRSGILFVSVTIVRFGTSVRLHNSAVHHALANALAYFYGVACNYAIQQCNWLSLDPQF